LVVALTEIVYADESGIQATSPYCIVAGYRGSPRQWKKFNTEWQAVLCEFKVTAPFHSKVFVNRKVITDPAKNPYLRWPDKKATEFHQALLDIFRRRQVYPVGCSVDVRAFRSYSHAEQCVLVGYLAPAATRRNQRKPAPYHLAFRYMVVDAVNEVHPDTEVHFVVSEQREYRQRALDGYAMTKQYDQTGQARRMKGISFEDPADFPGLQAADLLTHHWYNYSVRGRARLNDENVAAMNALTKRRIEMPHVNAESIEKMFAAVGVSSKDRERLRSL
jgi:hypothetical protein